MSQLLLPFRSDLSQEDLPIVYEGDTYLGPLHAYLNYKIDATAKRQLPIIKPVNDFVVPERLCAYYRLKNKKVIPGTCVHHFTDDRHIEPLWTRPRFYAQSLRKYDYVLSTDFSVHMDMFEEQKWWNDFRNKFLAAYFQHWGVNIIPAPSWADVKDIERYAEGWPTNSLIAINSTGIGTDKRSIFNWLDGYYEMIERLKPSHILRYGRFIEGENNEISTYYENNNKKGFYNGGKRFISA